MSSNTWFRIKFAVLILLACYVGIISLPNSVKDYLPEGELKTKLLSYQTTLGIDLSGGTSLEYKIDFTQAQARADASKADDNTANDYDLDQQKIAAGVVKTLKKRIDPDGTKEVGVFFSKRGDDMHVVVELTSALDTPENREKLQKVTSLQFKEPMSEEEMLNQTQALLDQIVAQEKNFEDIKTQVLTTKTGQYQAKKNFTKEQLSQTFGEEISTDIWESNAGVYPQAIALSRATALLVLHQKTIQVEEGEAMISTIEDGDTGKNAVEVLEIESLVFDSPWKDTGLGGAQFRNAKVGKNQQNSPVTEINFDAEGAKMFGDITGRLSKVLSPRCNGGQGGEQFAIFVDGKLESDPCVETRIDGGSAIISFGARNVRDAQTQASELAESLNSGATPAPVTLISERKISASLGESAFLDSVNAALFGFFLVALWIIFFYRFFGFLAVLALCFYAAVFIFLLKISGALVLTLAGVAGIILSIGMAVDANILIFERIREELKDGRNFKDAVQEGFDRAWTSIRDSNTSSLITSFILYALGTSIIMSFAITLAIGIVISMFTAIVFTRYLILGLTPKSLQNNIPLLIGNKKKRK